MSFGEKLGVVLARVRAFRCNTKANVAMMFAISLIPVTIAAGAGLDLTRAMIVKTNLSEALDAAALAVASNSSLQPADRQPYAQAYFNANYKADANYGTPAAVAVSVNGQSITVTSSVPMPTTLMGVAGIHTVNVASSSTVVWGQTKLWVSLVLDNTGSMCQSDNNPNAGSPCPNPGSGTKIASLQSATHTLLGLLQGAAANAGDVMVDIVPFVKDVNVDRSIYGAATWIDWTDWNSVNGSCSTNGSDQATCTVAHCSKPQYTTKTSCQNNNKTWYNAGTWTHDNHNTWNGCVVDRGNSGGPDTTNNYDVMNTAPIVGTTASMFSAEQYSSCPQAVMGLSSNWTSLGAKVDAMVADGTTNQTIGLMWGWHALSQGTPMSAAAVPANTARYIIILSDGLNTEDRWYGDGSNQSSQVDARMSLVCANAKADHIVIYSLFVDIGGTQGNSTVLQNCATDASKYYDLTSASQIAAAFNQIGQQITNLRVSQ